MKYQSEPTLNREQELVLACISANRANDKRVLEILGRELDWQVILQVSLFHEIFPLVYQRLIEVAKNEIPPAEMPRWEALFITNAYRNLRLTQKLIWVVNQLSEVQIDMVALKGPVLAQQVYGDLSLRSFVDLDILIHPEDFSAVYDILARSGFIPEMRLTPFQQKWLVASDNHFPFTHHKDILEVHWKIAEVGVIYPLDPENIWLDLTRTPLLEREISSLSPENAILLACLHGAKHGWIKLKMVTDLAFFIQSHPNIDWHNFLEMARRNRVHRLVCLGFLLAENPGGVVFDRSILTLVHEDEHAETIASRVRQSFGKVWYEPGQLGEIPFFLESRENIRDRLYFILDQLFVPKQADWAAMKLPEELYPLYYLIRPLRLLAKFGPAIFSSIKRKP